jgi:hypothetical protein
MRHTFKATFEHQNDAQRLMDDLHAAGYAHAVLARSGATHSGSYTRQRHAVMLSVDSESEASLAAGIIERAKPARFQVARNESVDSVTAGAPAKEEMAYAYSPRAEPGSLQFRPIDAGHIFGTQSATSPPTGTTFQEKMGSASLQTGADAFPDQSPVTAVWTDMDLDTDVNEHTAYRFGEALHMSDKYRNRSWNEAEPSVKSEWSARSTDSSTWENAKSSVRRGWDKSTPDIDNDDYYRSHWTTSYARNTVGRGGDDATPAYMDEGAAQGSKEYLSPAGEDSTGQLSSWKRFEDAVLHGWKRINLTGRDPGHASDTGATDEAYRASAAYGDATGMDPASATWNDKEHVEPHISPWKKVRDSMHHGWKRVRP